MSVPLESKNFQFDHWVFTADGVVGLKLRCLSECAHTPESPVLPNLGKGQGALIDTHCHLVLEVSTETEEWVKSQNS